MTGKERTDYQPIDCGLYSEYELAIMHRQPLRTVWVEGNVIFDRILLPTDLKTRSGEEFLYGRDEEGRAVEIRLDRIRSTRFAPK